MYRSLCKTVRILNRFHLHPSLDGIPRSFSLLMMAC